MLSSHAAWHYHVFGLSLRNVELLDVLVIIQVECSTGSGFLLSLSEVAAELIARLNVLFLRRAVFKDRQLFQGKFAFKDLIPFHA